MSANMSSFEGGAKMVWDMRSMQESLPLSERVIQAQNTSVRFYRFAEIQIGDIYQETRKLSVLARGISLKLLQRGHDTNPVLRPMLYGMLGGLGGLLVGSLLVNRFNVNERAIITIGVIGLLGGVALGTCVELLDAGAI